MFHDKSLLGRCLHGFVLPVLEYCSAVWCSAADTHLKLLDRELSCARFLTGGVFECDIFIVDPWQSCVCFIRSGVTRCTLLMVLYLDHVPVLITRGALVAHRYTYAPPRCRTSQYNRTFIPLLVSLWNDLANPVFHFVGLAGIKSRPMLFYWPKLLYPYYSVRLFFPFSSFCLLVGIVGLGSSD